MEKINQVLRNVSFLLQRANALVNNPQGTAQLCASVNVKFKVSRLAF